ncbi:hypothetical protein JA13_075 [Dickeya phage vB_DsoM_JA13]|uniref:Uncharacterized protein n=1 Tax=Dickeya phage vB_DsoM_JA13 TaxID=2283030 RepID=A0A384ZW61_9CAUD|nr:hypothetical protein JA13_075 [Dickeya phage vB_DsoM_JA13]
MISNKDMVASKALTALMEIFTPTSSSVQCRVGLFSGTMPDLVLPATIAQNMTIAPGTFLTALGITQAQFLGCQHYSTTVGRRPVVTIGKNADGSRNRKINVNFTAVTTDLIGAANGTPTFFVAMRSSASVTDASTWATFIGGTSVDDIIIGTCGNEDSDAELKIVGSNIVLGQGYRMTDLNIQY